jgi:hypothetical protein
VSGIPDVDDSGLGGLGCVLGPGDGLLLRLCELGHDGRVLGEVDVVVGVAVVAAEAGEQGGGLVVLHGVLDILLIAVLSDDCVDLDSLLDHFLDGRLLCLLSLLCLGSLGDRRLDDLLNNLDLCYGLLLALLRLGGLCLGCLLLGGLLLRLNHVEVQHALVLVAVGLGRRLGLLLALGGLGGLGGLCGGFIFRHEVLGRLASRLLRSRRGRSFGGFGRLGGLRGGSNVVRLSGLLCLGRSLGCDCRLLVRETNET